jgi:transposase
VDVCLISEAGEVVDEWAPPPDADGLRGLARRAGMHAASVRGVIESMNGARFLHDTLEELGWEVLIADAHKVKGLAPLAGETDRIDAGAGAAVLARAGAGDLTARSRGAPRARAGALSPAPGW